MIEGRLDSNWTLKTLKVQGKALRQIEAMRMAHRNI